MNVSNCYALISGELRGHASAKCVNRSFARVFQYRSPDLDHHADGPKAESLGHELTPMYAFYCCYGCAELGLAAESSSSNSSTWFKSPTAVFVVSGLLSAPLLVC
jgi:hypothetical protein